MTARVQVITPQQVEEKKRKEAYHNTLLLLSNSRNILWQTDSELDTFAAELNLPLQKLDAVLSRIDAEIGMENRRLVLRLEMLAKTRQLLDRINDALFFQVSQRIESAEAHGDQPCA